MSKVRLEQLFQQCDTNGTGFITSSEFSELCSGFDINENDASIIFTDLDHDGDGKISFDDFSFGFRDFLTPGSRRGSTQLGLEGSTQSSAGKLKRLRNRTSIDSSNISQEKMETMEKNHVNARSAWQQFTAHLSTDDIKKFLGSSGDKLFLLYEELQSNEAPSHLIAQFEDVISSVLDDVQNFERENRTMEEKYFREKETHTEHLKNIEAEMDAQVARVEHLAKEHARNQYEQEKRELQTKMEAEMAELQAHLHLFKKVDKWLHKEKSDTTHKENLQKLDLASSENRQLKNTLLETQSKISLMMRDLMDLRNQYEEKCSELNHERENKLEYMYEVDNIQRQLELLRGANLNLKDSNDGLQTLVGNSSPLNLSIELQSLQSPLSISHQIRETLSRLNSPNLSRRRVSSEYDSDSFISKSSIEKTKYSDPNYIDDIEPLPDSGNSTLPTADDDLRSSPDFDIGGPSELHVDNSFEADKAGHNSLSSEGSNHIILKKPSPSFRHSKKKRASTNFHTGGYENNQMSVARYLEPTGPPDRTYKVVFAGDAAVGKTSFINRITKGVFMDNLNSTLGVDFQVKTIRVDDRNIALQLWDTAGQERFRSVTRSYFRRADGVMLLYDVTSDHSFLSVRQWIQAVDDVSDKRIPIMLCGNKIDVRESSVNNGVRCVTREEGEKMAREHSAIFLETSSKSGTNIIDTLIQLSRDMCSNEDVEVQTSALKIREEDRKSKCCGNKGNTRP